MSKYINELMDYSWAAALLDGEGCINISKQEMNKKNYYQLHVHISNSDKILLDKFKTIFPEGNIVELKKQSNRKQMWKYTANGKKAHTIVQSLYPFLLAKKEQAGLGLSFDGTMTEKGKQRNERDILIQEHCYQKMKMLKKGEETSCGMSFFTIKEKEASDTKTPSLS